MILRSASSGCLARTGPSDMRTSRTAWWNSSSPGLRRRTSVRTSSSFPSSIGSRSDRSGGGAIGEFCSIPLAAVEAGEVVDEFIARVCRMDIDGAGELVTDDVEYDNVPMGKNHGRQGMKDFLGPMVGMVDGVEFIVHRQVADGNLVLNERTDRFVKGDMTVDLPVAGVFEVTDGKISLWRDYFDMAEV